MKVGNGAFAALFFILVLLIFLFEFLPFKNKSVKIIIFPPGRREIVLERPFVQQLRVIPLCFATLLCRWRWNG